MPRKWTGTRKNTRRSLRSGAGAECPTPEVEESPAVTTPGNATSHPRRRSARTKRALASPVPETTSAPVSRKRSAPSRSRQLGRNKDVASPEPSPSVVRRRSLRVSTGSAAARPDQDAANTRRRSTRKKTPLVERDALNEDDPVSSDSDSSAASDGEEWEASPSEEDSPSSDVVPERRMSAVHIPELDDGFDSPSSLEQKIAATLKAQRRSSAGGRENKKPKGKGKLPKRKAAAAPQRTTPTKKRRTERVVLSETQLSEIERMNAFFNMVDQTELELEPETP